MVNINIEGIQRNILYNSSIQYFRGIFCTFCKYFLPAGMTCVFSLVCALILGVLDKKRSKALHLDSAQSGEKVKLSDILTFPVSFWLISIICVAYYVAIFPFIGLAK